MNGLERGEMSRGTFVSSLNGDDEEKGDVERKVTLVQTQIIIDNGAGKA